MASVSRGCHYALLDVGHLSSPTQIKAAYRKLALKWHPDRNVGGNAEKASEIFKQITEAYDTLIDPAKRKDYDRERGSDNLFRRAGPAANGWDYNANNRRGYDHNSQRYRPDGSTPPPGGGSGFHFNLHQHMHYGDEIRSASGKISGESFNKMQQKQMTSVAFKQTENVTRGMSYEGMSERKKEVTMQDIRKNVGGRARERRAARQLRRVDVDGGAGGCIIS